jgi:hypothetical protein
MNSESPQTGQTTGRDTTGRFASGNRFGTARRRTASYQAAFDAACTPEALREVVAAMLDRAKRGSVSAARLIVEHCLGKPTVRVELGDDFGESFRVAGVDPQTHQQEILARIERGLAALRASREGPTDRESNGQASQQTT